MNDTLAAPFPYFGGKARVAGEVWRRFGSVRNYIEPFFGSGAVLLRRPEPFDGVETVNDIDGMISNFWRSVQADPEDVAEHADWPVNECDLHARHLWLLGRKSDLTDRLMADPGYYDVQAAGWWVWGISCWIGNGWCSGTGPWRNVDGRLARKGAKEDAGVSRQRPFMSRQGMGVHRQVPHLKHTGMGVHRKRSHLMSMKGVAKPGVGISDWFDALSNRLLRVRVCCGDWSRICGPSVCVSPGAPVGVFLDPPYSLEAGRDMRVYTEDSGTVAHDVREWALDHGDDPRYRIALCGYEGEHEMPGWHAHEWKTNGGYGSQGDGQGRDNSARERIWFSPHCLRDATLF